MNKLTQKLDRISPHLIGTASPTTSTPEPKVYQPPERYYKLASELGGEIICAPSGAYCLLKRTYPLTYFHGTLSLQEIHEKQVWPALAFTVNEVPGSLETKSLLFTDTETTGLGGTGTVAFLIGCGFVRPDGFEVQQYLLPDYSDEAAMLEVVNELFSSEKSIVSYNGLAFDIPLLRDRLIVNRIAREVASDRHLDLLHAVRRLYRRRLGDCSLTNIEREVFEFHRSDDIPGYLIPSVYFDWLAEESLRDMETVLEHNRLDILSLYFLGGLLASIFESEGSALSEVDDIHSLARLYGRRRQYDRTTGLFRKIETLRSRPLSPDVVLYHAGNFKRSNDWDEAVRLWQSLLGTEGREAYWAHVELAKYFEHRAQNFPRAIGHAETALLVAPSGDTHRHQLDRRLARLRRKLNS